jgi:hypothetical protein
LQRYIVGSRPVIEAVHARRWICEVTWTHQGAQRACSVQRQAISAASGKRGCQLNGRTISRFRPRAVARCRNLRQVCLELERQGKKGMVEIVIVEQKHNVKKMYGVGTLNAKSLPTVIKQIGIYKSVKRDRLTVHPS